MKRFFVSGTGTGVGKTFVTRGLVRAARDRGLDAVALKPLETGVDPTALDAEALARASGRPEVAHAPGFYRARLPLAPYAATIASEPAPPSIEAILAAVQAVSRPFTLVEGAGGVLVPITETTTVCDVIAAWEAPTILVAHDGLGVLSHTLTAVEALIRRALPLAAVALTQFGEGDPSTRSNLRILQERIDAPVVAFPACADDDAMLAEAAAPLLDRLIK